MLVFLFCGGPRSTLNPALGPMTDSVTETSDCINTETVDQVFVT
jgi:hypothetical protein